jgi:hypothetical protein
MVEVTIVEGDEPLDVGVEIPRQELVLQQEAVLESLMLRFDLALRLSVLGCVSDKIYAVIFLSYSASSPETQLAPLSDSSLDSCRAVTG